MPEYLVTGDDPIKMARYLPWRAPPTRYFSNAHTPRGLWPSSCCVRGFSLENVLLLFSAPSTKDARLLLTIRKCPSGTASPVSPRLTFHNPSVQSHVDVLEAFWTALPERRPPHACFRPRRLRSSPPHRSRVNPTPSQYRHPALRPAPVCRILAPWRLPERQGLAGWHLP